MKIFFAISLYIILIISLVGCGTEITADRDYSGNLAKLSRVWGFAKYTHLAFLSGEMCWNEELFNLIPIIYSANDDDVNDILYDWFVSLGDDGYGDHRIVFAEAQVSTSHISLLDEIPWFSLMRSCPSSDTIILQVYEGNLSYLETMEKELYWFSGLEIIDESEINFRKMADFGWINESYLGLRLFERLSRFQSIQPLDRTNAPVSFDRIGNSVFINDTNEFLNEDMDYSNVQYRLLGLFSMWNAIEYYFPYRDIIDRDWHKLLIEYIPKMMEGSCRSTYESTLASLSMHLHDAHVGFFLSTDFLYSKLRWILSYLENANIGFLDADFFNDRIGYFPLPARLVEAEGQIVVNESMFSDELLPGDVILSVNSRDINDITANMLQFMSYPNDGKALGYLSRFGLWSQSREMTVALLRGNDELHLQIEFNGWKTNEAIPSHEILENNIGLINPAHMHEFRAIHQIHWIMQDLSDTDGLIVDLRQFPSDFIVYLLAEHLVEENQLFAIGSSPSMSIPGVFIDSFRAYSGGIQSFGAYFYENPVVLLMDEWTISQAEFTIMSLRNGSNVTVMGNNSMGANGNVTFLPLPGGLVMMYTGLGIYTSEGDQTQRIGLSPDIYVNRTIQGIAEGRDELMEAAVAFLLEFD